MELKDGISEFAVFCGTHQSQLVSSDVPELYWKTLWHKLKNEIFNAGSVFNLIQEVSEEENESTSIKVIVSHPDGVRVDDESQIYLVDHAWLYEANKASSHLLQVPGLLDRMCNLMNVDETLSNEDKIKLVCKKMWKYNQTYSFGIGNVENRMPLWYIVDEFGCAIQHSDKPNFRMVPFYYAFQQASYSLLFPIQNCVSGDEVTRDYVESPLSENSLYRKALLLPWISSDLSDVSYKQEAPSSDYFIDGHILEIMPERAIQKNCNSEKILKVFSNYSFINAHLTDSNFQVTTSFEEADILWLTDHFKDYKKLSEEYPEKYINQFPYEHVITVKDLLAIVSRRCDKNSVLSSSTDQWLPATFNLKSELPQWVSYFQYREKNNLDNHWICKPWNLARGLDTHITNNLDYILRLPFSGPKIAQKYISDPVLFSRPEIGLVKFDVRYVLLVKSAEPLQAYAYRNFFLRFSNVAFSLDEFENYEKHFTVMNYNESALFRMLHDQFIEEFEKQHINEKWADVEVRIFQMFKELFQAATSEKPPCGIGANPQSRALYAADIMLSWNVDQNGTKFMQPQLLEINWMPDCQRACDYYPNFYNDIFLLLFRDVENNDVFRNLSE